LMKSISPSSRDLVLYLDAYVALPTVKPTNVHTYMLLLYYMYVKYRVECVSIPYKKEKSSGVVCTLIFGSASSPKLSTVGNDIYTWQSSF
jgi:hypothetical protein